MSELNKPTIDGLIEKLIEGNQIEANEAETAKALLEQASNGLDKDEIFTLVTRLSAKLDAPSNDLVTPNGLNYAGFDSAVKEVSKVIKKEKVQREKAQAEATRDELQGKENTEKTPQEKAEIERQERIEANKKYIDEFFSRHPEFDFLVKTEEEKQVLAENMEKKERYYEVINELEKKGLSPEKAEKQARDNLGMTKEDVESYESKEASAMLFAREIEKNKAENPEVDSAEFGEKLIKSNKALYRDMERNYPEIIKRAKNGEISWFQCVKEIGLNFSYEKVESEIDRYNTSIKANKKDSNQFNVFRVKEQIDKLEENKLKRKKVRDAWYKITKNKNIDLENQELFEELTIKYLTSDKSVADLYKELDGDKRIENLEFEDLLDGIIKNLEKNSEGPTDVSNLNTIRENERKMRRYELFKEEFKDALGKEQMINGFFSSPNQTYLKQLDKEYKEHRTAIIDIKIIFRGKRELYQEISEEGDTPRTSESQQEPVSMPKVKGIEVSEIEIGGIKPDVAKIAQKGKVTPKGIKGMFAKIKELHNAPKKSKQEATSEITQDVTREEPQTSSDEAR